MTVICEGAKSREIYIHTALSYKMYNLFLYSIFEKNTIPFDPLRYFFTYLRVSTAFAERRKSREIVQLFHRDETMGE